MVVLCDLKAALEANKAEWDVKQITLSIPSFKVIHRASGIKCDISVCNGLSVQNSKLFAHLFNIQPEAIALYHFCKRWLQIFDVQILKGFSLTLMIVFFLQQNNLMPTIENVQKNLTKIVIDGRSIILSNIN